VYVLDDYEVATRLSYLLWGSTPDAALLDDAEAGRLSDVAGVRDAALRLLEHPRACNREGEENAAVYAESEAPCRDACRDKATRQQHPHPELQRDSKQE